MKKNLALLLLLGCMAGSQVVLAQDDDEEKPFIKRPRCDAEIVVEHMGMRKSKWLEVIDNLETMGSMTKEWADEYRQLIEEAYALETDAKIVLWLATKCKTGIKG